MEKKSILFLSDITEDSFELRDRSSDLDLEHMKVAMKYLARLHAPTYVYNMHGLRDNRISDLPSIGKCQMHPDNMYFHIFTAGLRLLAIEMKTWMGLERFEGTVLNMARRAYHEMINFRKAGNLKVLVHGDFWHSNIFFKYEEYDDCGSRIRVPERSRFIDFQWCQWGSPAIDILTLLYVSAETEVFANHRNDLIDIYYTEMRQLINKIATKENIIIFSMEKEELYNDIKKMEIYGLYLGLTYRWIRRASPHRPAFFDTLTNYKCFEEKSFWRTLIRTHRRELEPAFKLFLSRVFDV